MAQRVVNAGIDVSKQWLDVALWPTREIIRDGEGLRELAS
jgi:transposase